ncbi:MAG: PAS domain S-box protein, partial [Bacteroidota bacterium]
TVSYWNKTWLDYTGQKREEAAGRAWDGIIHPDDVQLVMDYYVSAFTNRQPYFIPAVRTKQKDGAYRWHAYKGNPRYLPNGDFNGYIGVGFDVHEQKLVEDALAQQKRLYETVTDNTEDLIYIFDLNYRFTFANEALLTMWGKTWNDAIGKRLLENGYEPWHAEMHEREIDQVVATKKSIRGEVSFPHATQGKRVYDYIFTPVLNQEGKVEAIAGTTRDITDIKLAEETLKESEERFGTLADNMENLAWIADGEGWIYWYNKRWYDYTGTTLEEMEGWGWQKVHHPDHVERVLEATKKLWLVNETFELTFPLRRHDGEYRWFLTRGRPITDANGSVIKWLGTNTDITNELEARKRTEENEKKLQKTNTWFDIATNASGVGTWSLDVQTSKLEWSALHKKMWGYDEHRTDLVYEDWYNVIEPADKEAAFAEVNKALITKTVYEAT